MSGTGQGYGFGGSPFNFGGYPGIYGGGYGGGFNQPTFSYQNTFVPNSGYSNPVNPNTMGQPTSNLGFGSFTPPPFTGQYAGSSPAQGLPQLPRWYVPGPYAGGPSGETRPVNQTTPTSPTPTSTSPTPTPPTTSPPGSSLETRPKDALAQGMQQQIANSPLNGFNANTQVQQAIPKGDNFSSQGITPITRSYDPTAEGYTNGGGGQYHIRPNALVTQALQADPRAVFNLLPGTGGDFMSNYKSAANALQAAGFGGGDFNTAFGNLLQGLQGAGVRSLQAQYQGLPSYFYGT